MAANLTPKQQRNGISTSAGERNSAQPGPDATAQVSAAKAMAEAAGNRRKNEAAGLIRSPQGSGVSGHTVGTGGSTFDWKSGLAVNES